MEQLRYVPIFWLLHLINTFLFKIKVMICEAHFSEARVKKRRHLELETNWKSNLF